MLQSYQYGFISMVKNKAVLFWTLAFPIILGTFFNIAFGSITKNTETFSMIKVAVVVNGSNETADYFLMMIESLSQGEDALISPRYVNIEQAEKMLSDGETDGIFHIDKDIQLVTLKQGLNQSILKSISDRYIQTFSTIENIIKSQPDMAEKAVADLLGEIKINKEISLGRGETDIFIQYYYALIAMTCLYGSFFGHLKVIGIQADKSPLAARRCISPSKKISMILSDLMAAVTLQFLEALVVVSYLTFILGINFSGQIGFVILTCLVGSIIGVSYGVFITSIVKAGNNTVNGILSATVLLLCFLSGLMVAGMKNIIERTMPVINRINPAALLSDAFYCLTVYDNYNRYTQSIVSMLMISAIFCITSAFVLRRKRYASI